MDWQFDDDRPIYTQLIQQIQRAVVTGVYAPGEKLPGVRELAAAAGVNPNTMQRALAQLEAEGLLHTQRTAGRFVTEDAALITSLKQQLGTTLSHAYVQDMRAIGCENPEIDRFVQAAQKEDSPT